MRPQPRDERPVARAREILACEHHEERRRIDAAVVASERHFAEARHFGAARLVQDLAGFGVLLRVDVVRLGGGQVAEDAARELRMDPEQLQGGNDAVAPKRRAEPGHAGVRVLAARAWWR